MRSPVRNEAVGATEERRLRGIRPLPGIRRRARVSKDSNHLTTSPGVSCSGPLPEIYRPLGGTHRILRKRLELMGSSNCKEARKRSDRREESSHQGVRGNGSVLAAVAGLRVGSAGRVALPNRTGDTGLTRPCAS